MGCLGYMRMRNVCHIFVAKLLVLIPIFILASDLWADDGYPNSLEGVAFTPQCSINKECSPALAFLKRPSDYKDDDAFYREYVAPSDARIAREYMDRWRYQEMQILYASTTWNYEHVSIGSQDVLGRGQYDGDVRRQFAQQVLRIRTDAMIRNYFAPNDRAAEIKSAQRALNSIKNVPLKISKDEHGGEFHFGYDVFSDSTKLEYLQGPVQAGFYHPHLIGALTGSARKIDALNLKMSARTGVGMPTANVSYSMNGAAIEGSLSEPLSPVVVAELVSRQPIRDQTIQHSYGFRVTYRF